MKKTSKNLLFCLLFGILLLTWEITRIYTPQMLQSRLTALESWAVPAYIGLWLLLPVFFFPVPVLALTGGLLFDLWQGSLYTFIGAMLNCSLMFLIARFMGRAQVKGLVERKLGPVWQTRLKTVGGRQGFWLLILLRLIPAVPYNLINYAFGMTEMRFSAYLLGTAIGILPGTFAFINIGDKAIDMGSPSFWLAIVLLLLLLITTSFLGKKIFPSKEDGMRRNEHEK